MSPRALLVLLVPLVGSWLVQTPARAEQSDALEHALVRLAPSAASVQAARVGALEQRLEHSLAGWSGAARVEVQLFVPLASELPLDRPLPAPRATVLLTVAGPSAPPRDEVFRLLRGALPGLEESALTLLIRAPSASSATNNPPGAKLALTSVGPFQVAATSAPALRMTIAFSLAIHALFAAIVLWRVRQNRPAARKVDPRARTSFPP